MKSDCSGFLEKYLDSERIFVFPSEIAAYEWAAYALKNGNRTAVDRDRFISWDTFKEQCFQLFQKEKPVNRTLRSLYAAHLLDKNRKEKFLEWFVRPEHAELSLNFRKTVESVLMSFNSAGQLLKSPLPAELKKDLSLLYERYSLFLKKHGLFEPSGIRPEIDTAGKKYLIIVPDIISDFEEYRTLLEKEKDIDFNFFPEPENTVLYEFRTVSREHRYIAEGFEKMLKNDPQASLAVSCTSETEQGYLLREFRTRAIPFTVRGGSPLSGTPGARVFRHLGKLLSARPGIGLFRSVFADNAVPWKEKDQIKEMIIHLAGSNYVMNSGMSGKDELNRILKRTGKEEYLNWYKKLNDSLGRIRQSSSFENLAESVQSFVFGFIDISSFSAVNLAEYQLCVADLLKLSVLKEQIQDLNIPDLYAVFLDQLEQHIYVPRQENTGVQVFPYRVAAGIPADLYILSGCSQSGIRVRQNPFPFLRDDQRKLLDAGETDFSEAFVKAYLSCSAVCTFSRETNEGPALPSGYFIRKNALKQPDESISLYEKEKKLWTDGKSDFHAYPAMTAGLERYVSVNSGSGRKDYSKGEPVHPDILSRLTGSKNGVIRLSASSLDTFLSCPYFYLNSRLFGFEALKTEPDFIDHLIIGTIEHRTLEKFFLFVREKGGKLSGCPEAELRKTLDEIFKKTAFAWYSSPWFEPAYLADMDAARNALSGWLDTELKQFAKAEVLDLELELEYADRGTDVVFNGKIDRVSSENGSQFIVDYKKGGFPSNAKIRSMEIGSGAIQIPFYLLLMRKNGRNPERALYCSLRDGKYVSVFGSGRNEIDEELMDKIISTLETRAADAAGKIRQGVFTAEYDSCGECDLQGLCRRKFFLE